MNIGLNRILSAILERDSETSSIAIDVGAYQGAYSESLIKTRFFSKVLAFEPNVDSYRMILKKFSLPHTKFEVVNCALGFETGSHNMYCDADSATASLLQYSSDYVNQGSIRIDSVSVMSLDNYLDKTPINGQIKLLKIDTQGNDLNVVRGAEYAIRTHRPIVQTEFIYLGLYNAQCSPQELTEELLILGYNLYNLHNLHVTPEGRLAFCDAIFIPSELQMPTTQIFSCIDDTESHLEQIKTLTEICAERLKVINILNSEVYRIRNDNHKVSQIDRLLARIKSWVQ